MLAVDRFNKFFNGAIKLSANLLIDKSILRIKLFMNVANRNKIIHDIHSDVPQQLLDMNICICPTPCARRIGNH